MLNSIKNNLNSFAKDSTIHGVHFIAGENRNKITRIFWALSFICATSTFIFHVHRSYEKWKIKPDIAMRKHQKFVGEIPFPALTICSPVFAKDNFVDYENLYRHYSSNLESFRNNITSKEANYLISNMQACSPGYLTISAQVFHRHTDNNTVKLLNQSSFDVDEIMASCSYNSVVSECSKLFNRVLTDKGFCYTFNMQGFSTIFNADVISKDFDCYKRTKIAKSPFYTDPSYNKLFTDVKPTKEWSLDQGFSTKHSEHEIPVVAQKGLSIALYLHHKKKDADNLCPALFSAFNYYFHLPNEILTPMHLRQFVPFGQKKFVSLSARAYKTNEGLRKLKPKVRDCYFEGEKKLKFFKSYTKRNCEFECMTNYTLKICGCSKFSMPREQNTSICTVYQARCYYMAMNEWPIYNRTLKKATESCNCLDTCTNIKYKVNYEELSEESLHRHIDLKDQGITEKDEFSFLIFTFGDHFIIEEEDYAPYALQNYTGGLLGLFIGCSILSLIEILYFTVSTLSIMFKKITNSELEKNDIKVNVIDVKPTIFKMQEYNVELQKFRLEVNYRFKDFQRKINKRDAEFASVLTSINKKMNSLKEF
ncbi:hypothetical protein PVAND_010015 [Polypedilum vanderplanki]|uniref:Uncharacterized protein n=1 Tax=Polypedilum vanderplanki TaxID=319348 RepID=A0A9J6CEJ3_POLVA|nr:hypothetical protein PVAND_010015 [Polypedilum vanderplanki]